MPHPTREEMALKCFAAFAVVVAVAVPVVAQPPTCRRL